MGKKFKGIILLIVVLIAASGCSTKKEPITRTSLMMGTVIKITLYDGNEEILNKAFKRIEKIENLTSINKSPTELTQINENSGVKGVSVSDETYDIIKKGLYYSKISDGDYDISVGPIVKAWSIGLPEAKVPSDEEIKEKIALVNYNDVKINDSTQTVFLQKKGMMLDLGSIAKGYVADEVAELLVENNVKKAIIDIGGNIYALGTNGKNQNWNIGIQNPFKDRGSAIGSVSVSDKSVVTTGVYERFIEKDGKKYHHILNPKTGYPYETEIVGVSIVGDKSIDCDALSTLIFTKGVKEGVELLEKIDGIEAIFITKDKKVYLTKGIKNNFKLIDDSFKVQS